VTVAAFTDASAIASGRASPVMCPRRSIFAVKSLRQQRGFTPRRSTMFLAKIACRFIRQTIKYQDDSLFCSGAGTRGYGASCRL
jgi:hypothetical protein